jgi:hypothetical protein
LYVPCFSQHVPMREVENSLNMQVKSSLYEALNSYTCVLSYFRQGRWSRAYNVACKSL